MAVTLRLARHGSKKRPFYRIVAAEKGCKRDGRCIEVIGVYHPIYNPPHLALKEDRVKHWIEHGAQSTQTVRALIKKTLPGFLEPRDEARLNKIKARRRARKERSKTPAKASAKTPARRKKS